MNQSTCQAVLDDLAIIISGDDDVIDAHLDHLADCDACRDARHEASLLAGRLAVAGDDYVEPADMQARVLAALDAGEAEPERQLEPEPQPEPQPEPEPRPGSARRSRWKVYALAAAGVLVAGGAGLAIYGGGSKSGGVAKSAPLASAATVVTVDRAANDGEAGLEIRGPGSRGFARLDSGATIPPGSTVRTDERTRAMIRLADGSELALNHLTELTTDADRARTVRVTRGALVAEVAKRPQRDNALFITPGSRVEVLGTRFLLTVADEVTSVRVTRGSVRLTSSAGEAQIGPGEEGIARLDAAPSVAPATNLAASVAWSELTQRNRPGDSAAPGIGELRAFKPGEKRDRDWKLRLSRHRVTVRIVGNVARTEIEETFQNDSDTTLEGVYKFPLPPDARIDRLALDVEGKFEEGAFVEKARAAKIWRGVIAKATPKKKRVREEIIWVPGPWRDPALLDWKRGGRFELRIFPIPKRGARTIKIAYTQTIAPHGSKRRYVYPLPHSGDGSSAADDFDVDVRVSGANTASPVRALGPYTLQRDATGAATRLTMARSNFVPRGDLVIEYQLPDSAAEVRAWTFRGDVAAAPGANTKGKRGGIDPAVVAKQRSIANDDRAFALFSIRPRLPQWRKTAVRDYVLVVDSSQSMVGERYKRASKMAVAVIGEMDRRDRFTLMTCDLDCRTMSKTPLTPSGETARRAERWLGDIEVAGASDLVRGLEHAARIAKSGAGSAREAWVVYLGDGTPSVGHRTASAISTRLAAIRRDHRVSVSAVGIGGDADTTTLATVARAGGGHYIPFVPGARLSSAALSVLETTYGVSLRDPVLELPAGMEDIGPVSLPTLRAGGELLVAARFRGRVRGNVTLRGTVGGKPYVNRFPVELTASTARGNAFVPRMWAALTIDRLELEGRGEDRVSIVALSKGFGVLSRYTSLLVLESEAMFKAFGVDRAQPTVRWNGEDDEVEVVESSGLIDYAKTRSVRDKSGKTANKPSKGYSRTSADLFDPVGIGRRGPRLRRRGRRMIPMKRIWERKAFITPHQGTSKAIRAAVARAESALQANPNSRERHRNLVQALSYAGELDRAYTVAQKWLERDRLDPEALVYMADLVGRRGERARSLRLLSGIVDVSPDNAVLHRRLARAYERTTNLERACAHRIALAALSPKNANAIGRAVRCERALGHLDGADSLLRAVATSKARRRAVRAAARPTRQERVRGDLVIDATWDRATDIDVTVVTPQGTRLSWMGGRKSVVASNAFDRGRERLGLRRLSKGLYLVEVSRVDDRATGPIAGSIRVRALGKTLTLPFRLVGNRAVIGRIAVRMRSRLVPID